MISAVRSLCWREGGRERDGGRDGERKEGRE